MPTWTDELQAYSAIISALIAAISISFVVMSLRQAARALSAQNRSTDVGSILALFDRIDNHWRRFNDATATQKIFEFGQLISYYELASNLFRQKTFQTSASSILYEHLHDVLTSMKLNNDFKRMFDELHTQPDNFENIYWLSEQRRKIISRPKTFARRIWHLKQAFC